jgi:hypothetical protein
MKLNDLYMKAFSAKSADKFLIKFADVLNEITILQPILNSNLLPTPKVSAICQVLWAEVEKQQSVKQLEKRQVEKEPKEPKESKPRIEMAYTVSIMVLGRFGKEEVGYNDKGKELTKEFPTMQSAQTWAENQMWDRGDAMYARMIANKLIGKNGAMVFNISRESAMYNKLKDKASPECKRVGTTSSTLGFVMKVRNDKSYFSRG